MIHSLSSKAAVSLFFLSFTIIHEMTPGTVEEEKHLIWDRRKQVLWKCVVNCHRYHLVAQFSQKPSLPLSPHFLRSLENFVQLITSKTYLEGIEGQSETWLSCNYPSGRCSCASGTQSWCLPVPLLGFM